MFTATWSVDRRSGRHQAGASAHRAGMVGAGQVGGHWASAAKSSPHRSSHGPRVESLVCDSHWAQLGPPALSDLGSSAGSQLWAPGPSLSLQALRVVVPQHLGQSTCRAPAAPASRPPLATLRAPPISSWTGLGRREGLQHGQQSPKPGSPLVPRVHGPHTHSSGIPEPEPLVGLHLDPARQVLSPPQPAPLGR